MTVGSYFSPIHPESILLLNLVHHFTPHPIRHGPRFNDISPDPGSYIGDLAIDGNLWLSDPGFFCVVGVFHLIMIDGHISILSLDGSLNTPHPRFRHDLMRCWLCIKKF